MAVCGGTRELWGGWIEVMVASRFVSGLHICDPG